MKHGGPYTVHDCHRTTRAIANANGKIVFLYTENMNDPKKRRRGRNRAKRERRHEDAGMDD